ncbi:hypothetical protein IR152_05175 [Clostridioides sp. ES-S-0108-01]|nr:hypothetical protein [Clostridioides sp. ES-S-0108-01]UDN50947.1 hypothetical protein JJC16_16695 [Clostridioides sp. ES-S-0107-01]
MSDKVMYITGVIDTELWDKAKWLGTAILSDKKSAPYLGLLFTNRDAAIKIFEQWNKDFGHRDIYEEMRVSVIEGDIQGQEHGYTIHITTNQENLISKYKKLNLSTDEISFAIISRYRRMPTAVGNRNMANFREEVERFLSYKIIPVYMSESGLEPLFDYEIEKTEIFFRQVDEITEQDIDYACIKPRDN